MRKKKYKASSHRGLQVVTLCISTAMVLILLGLVFFSVLTGRNLSSFAKENIVVTAMLEQGMTPSESQRLCKRIARRPYVHTLTFISAEQALKEATKQLGTNPQEFVGDNPFPPYIEITPKADYANNDSLRWISKELKANGQVSEVSYQFELVEQVNRTIAKISIALLVLAALLTFISFALINNTVRLSIYARRFSIHTMKLVGASWGFIRRPFLRNALVIGLVSGIVADGVLGGCLYLLWMKEPSFLNFFMWQELAIVGGAVLLFGIVITLLCAGISVNKFLRMKAGELYKI